MILRGVYPEPKYEILRFAQDDAHGAQMEGEGLKVTQKDFLKNNYTS
jgi:hypothetical protein